MNANKHETLLHKQLSYEIQGAAIEVRKNFGPGHKEIIYQNAFSEELKSRNLRFEKEKSIQIFSPKTGKLMGSYRPDFIVEGKILIELKAVENIPKLFLDQLFSYLRNSEYELGYFINFSSQKLYLKRIIFTNDRKRFLNVITKLSCLLVFIFVSFSVSFAQAPPVQLWFEAPGELRPGTEFVATVFAESAQEINAFSAVIAYPAEVLQFKSADTANSIINFWARRPAQQEPGLIAFEGGIIGEALRGRGELVAFRFTARAEGRAAIRFLESQILLADGRGTPAAISQGGIEIIITADAPIVQVTPTQDTIPPEITLAEIIKSPVDNTPILIFQIAERESGLAGSFVRFRKWFGWAAWQEAENQIGVPPGAWQMQIRAVDNFGNEALHTLSRQNVLTKKIIAGALVVLLAITIGVLAALRKLRSKSKGDTARDTKT